MLCYALKRGESTAIDVAADRVRSLAERDAIRRVLGADATLVPMPGHALRGGDGLWVSLLIANALAERALGQEVEVLLERTQRVRKSATAPRGQRPGPLDHYQSLLATRNLHSPQNITIVDDVVTRGATMLGAAARLREAFPDASVRGFAMVRTQSTLGEAGIQDPQLCMIRRDGYGPRRIP